MKDYDGDLRLLTLSEAAAILQVSRRTILRMVHQMEVPAFKVGGQWRLRESQFRQWLEEKEGQAKRSYLEPYRLAG
ncbi:MAG: helix-turn-helix domain-containing protein [Deltaproteobacteria bacterium]|nr:helix-turn-helix domain-containing protein [Deltaproteobacteria bacterium]